MHYAESHNIKPRSPAGRGLMTEASQTHQYWEEVATAPFPSVKHGSELHAS